LFQVAILYVVVAHPAFGCEVLVAAASDLAHLENKLSSAVPPCSVKFSIGSSGMLARQIRYGAPFDVYLSANKAFVDEVIAAGAADPATVTTYARGRIALWSRNPIDFHRLRSVQRLAIANPAHAPYGIAARQALERQGLWPTLQSKTVYAENVRQALQFAMSGNADAAIVSWSLVHDRGGRLLDESWHDPIIQTGVVPKRAANSKGGKRLLQFLKSPAGQKILADGGLTPVP
jgi:molybdate transport system substrate-binding protein